MASLCLIDEETDPRPCTCGNCGAHFPAGKLHDIADPDQRLDPGCVVPAGQCPDCGALAYLDDPTI